MFVVHFSLHTQAQLHRRSQLRNDTCLSATMALEIRPRKDYGEALPLGASLTSLVELVCYPRAAIVLEASWRRICAQNSHHVK